MANKKEDTDTHDHVSAVEKVYGALAQEDDDASKVTRKKRLDRKKGFDSFSQPVAGGAWANSTDNGIDPQVIDSLFVSEDWVYLTVDTLARQAKLATPIVKRYSENAEGGEEAEIVPNHPAQVLMETPNKYQSSGNLTYSAAVNYFLQGNIILWYAKSAGQLWVLPAGRVYPQISPNKGIYAYTFSADYEIDPTTSANIDADQIVHVRRENPFSVYWGLSPFIPGRRPTQFNQYAQEYLTSFFQKGATFPVILTHDTATTEEKMLYLLKRFEQAYTGRTNQRRALMLPKGMQAQVVDHKIADTEVFTAIKQNRETILAILGVSKHAVGLQESGSLGSEEHKASLRYMWASAVYPMLTEYSDALTRHFKGNGLLEQNEYIDWDCSATESFSESLAYKAEAGAKLLLAGMTVNEVRTQIFELDPIDNGDMTPAIPVAAPAYPQQFAPPPPKPTDPAEPPIPSEEEEEEEEKSMDRKAVYFQTHADRFKAADEKFSSAESVGMGKIAGMTLGLFGDQLEIVLEMLAKKKSMKATFKWSAEDLAQLEKDFAALGPKWNADYTEALFPTTLVGQDIAVSTAFFVKDPDTVAALVAQEAESTAARLEARGFETFAGMNEVTTNDIMKIITGGVESQSTVQEISRAIAEKIGEYPSYRTERIARTETLTAVSLGQKITNDVIAKEFADRNLRKVWITGNDSRVRDSHASLHQTHVAIDEEFGNGLDHPRALGAPASETINCRCTYVLVTAEEIGG